MSYLIPTDGENQMQIKTPPVRVRWVRGENGVAARVIRIPLTN